jgi:hypothetical protein
MTTKIDALQDAAAIAQEAYVADPTPENEQRAAKALNAFTAAVDKAPGHMKRKWARESEAINENFIIDILSALDDDD